MDNLSLVELTKFPDIVKFGVDRTLDLSDTSVWHR